MFPSTGASSPASPGGGSVSTLLPCLPLPFSAGPFCYCHPFAATIAPDGTASSNPLRRSTFLSRTGSNPEIISIATNPAGNQPRILLRIRASLPGNN